MGLPARSIWRCLLIASTPSGGRERHVRLAALSASEAAYKLAIFTRDAGERPFTTYAAAAMTSAVAEAEAYEPNKRFVGAFAARAVAAASRAGAIEAARAEVDHDVMLVRNGVDLSGEPLWADGEPSFVAVARRTWGDRLTNYNPGFRLLIWWASERAYGWPELEPWEFEAALMDADIWSLEPGAVLARIDRMRCNAQASDSYVGAAAAFAQPLRAVR